LNPDSFEELSAHERSIRLSEIPAAESPDGAVGAPARVVAEETLE